MEVLKSFDLFSKCIISFIVYLQISSPCPKRLTFLLICEMIVIYCLRDLTAHMNTAGVIFLLYPLFMLIFIFE